MIKINENYALGSEKMNWVIYHKVKPDKTRPNGWKAETFYAGLPQAAKALKHQMLRVSDYSSAAELLAGAESISKLFDKELFNNESVK